VSVPYTLSVWQVKPGRESDFVERWRDWAEWTVAQGLDAPATLLRDLERPGRFVSFGPWETLDAIARWRTAEGYQERVRRLQEVVESFEPSTLEQVAAVL
jgi:heme-degrading monooxygenase HmoA